LQGKPLIENVDSSWGSHLPLCVRH